LQSCLVNDAAHVTPGSRGPHVAKIQSAVLLLEKLLNIPIPEVRSQQYGPGTAAAVLTYKAKRNIVNRAYQSAPDNIVGKMTIARLDEDLLAVEQRASLGRVVCQGSANGGGEAARNSPQKVGAPPPRKTFTKARATVVFQETDAAVAAGGNVALIMNTFRKARELMAPQGLDFAGADEGIGAVIGPRIPDSEWVLYGSDASTFSVRASAERVLPGQASVLRVIFCPFKGGDNTFGYTSGGKVADWNFPRFCLINVCLATPDQATVLHEMIHATTMDHLDHDTEATSVFSMPPNFRTQLPLVHAERIAHAFYSVILG
jgi:hypothetical protein